MSEDRLQQECYMWFHNKFPLLRGLLFHVPNGGARNPREGKKFKSMGVYPGVADLLFIYDGNLYAFELKTETGRQSGVQKTWQVQVENHLAEYYIVRELEVFQNLIYSIV